MNKNGLEWGDLTQMTIISTTVGKNPLEEMEYSRVAAAFSSYDGDLNLPLGLALEAQSSPWVARESWGLRSSHRRAEETSPRREIHPLQSILVC